MEEDKESLVSALLACQSRADLRQLQGMVSPSFPFITLACKHNRADLLHFLLEDETSSLSDGAVFVVPHWCSVEQEYEGHDAAYYAIRSSNVELLRTLLAIVTPELSERLVSKSYEKLLLNNVLVSQEMHMFIQYTLHDLRFFSKGDGVIPATSSANIQERVQLLLENVAQVNTYTEVDSHFLYTAKFIAQNIHILKQQLKSTYDRLPWEEMEFCLVSFVSAHIRRQEMNLYYLSVLRKDRLLNELGRFVFDLQELKKHIESTDIQNLRKPIKLGREDIAATISIRYPHLYADYKEVRDISSLHIMKTYLDAALLADSDTRVGQLTIKRALQVTGEHLMNTLDNPKLSPAMSDLLFLSVPKETRKVLLNLRNALSHPHQESESVQFSNIQNDIKKIASAITDITFSNKMDKIKCLLFTLINSDRIEKIQEIVNVFLNAHHSVDVQEINTTTKDHRKIEDLIRSIEDLTPDEKSLAAEIKDALDKIKSQHHVKTNYYFILNAITTITLVYNNPSTNTVQNIKRAANRILQGFPSQKKSLHVEMLKNLGSLLTQFNKSPSMRNKPETAIEIQYVIERLNCTQSIDKRNINCIDDYGREFLVFGKRSLKFFKNSEELIGEELTLKLTELENTLGVDRISGQLYEHLSLLHNDKNTNQFMVEALVMDIITLLDSSNCFPNNILYLDGDVPLLNGKCLRNHLAHGYALVDILPTDAWSAVLLSAMKLIESKDLLLNCKIGNILTHNMKQLRRKYKQGLSVLDKQKEMWKSLLDGNFEKFASEIAEGADIHSRNDDLSSTLHYAVRGSNIKTVKFLIEQEMISTEVRDINGQTVLHVAAAFGRDATVEFLVGEMGNAIDQIDNAGKTPLHLASQNGHKKTVVTLLSLGAKINFKDNFGFSPLHYAVMNVVKTQWEKEASINKNTTTKRFTYLHITAEYVYVEIVYYLLQNGADVNAKTDQGTIPLHLAAANGCLEVVKPLLQEGADVNLRDCMGQTSLYFAVENSHEEIVKILLEEGAIVNYYRDVAHNCSPSHLAFSTGNAIMVDLLLKYNTDVNAKINGGLTPLHLAAKGGHANMVDLLLRRKALADSRDDDGKTAIHYAAQRGHTSVLDTLIQWGGHINIQNKSKVTPLHLAAQAGHLQVVSILLAAGADVNYVSNVGVTALHLSAANDHEAISEALIKKGAEVNCKDKRNNTPLHSAATRNGNERIIQILLKYGANVNKAGQINRTALHVASFNGNSSVVEALLQGKAVVDAQDNDGTTALHLAVYGNHKAVVEVLLKYEADVNHIDTRGFFALYWAARNNYIDLMNLLISRGADVNVDGGKLLFTAIKAGHRLLVEGLLKNKDVDINIKDHNGLNLLYAAAESGDEEIAKALIKRGIILADCKQGLSPLFIAISLGHTPFVKVLLENGADVNPTDPKSSPLYSAVYMNKPDILERLLRSGANSNIRNTKNETPLELAVNKSQIQNTSILLQHCDRINERDNNNRTLLHIAAKVGNLEVTKLLVDRKADINARDRQGFKPIHIAATHGHHNILAFFLDLGISIDDRGYHGYTLMHCAAVGLQLAVTQYLIDKHADINSTDLNGSMPIHCSAKQGHTEMVKLLLHSGAMYDARDNLGRTPAELTENRDITEVLESIGKLFNAVEINDVLVVGTLTKELRKYLNVKSFNNTNQTFLHTASQGGFQDVCDILLKSKANPNTVGKDGETPLHYASKYSHPGIVESLLKNGAVHNLKSVNSKTPLDFATHEDIKHLLQIVALCFQKIQTGDVTVIEDITKIRDVEIIKAVMKASDTDGNTLVVVAMKKGFPNIAELKQVLQPLVLHILPVVEIMLTSERFTEALNILKQLLNERTEILGVDNPGTLDIQYKIAMVMFKQTKYFEANIMLEDIYRKRVEVFGPYHPDSLETRSSLALLLHRLGRNTEAWDILKEIMPIQRKVLGEGHEELKRTKNVEKEVLQALGKYDKSLQIHTQVYKTYERTSAAQHPNLSSQNNRAEELLRQGKYDEAFGLFQTIYEEMKLIFGQNHSDTLKVRFKMAKVLVKLHRLIEALLVFQETLDIQKNVLGLNHEVTVHTQSLITQLRSVHKAELDAKKTAFGPKNSKFQDLKEFGDNVKNHYKSIYDVDVGFITPCDFNLLIAASDGDIDEVRRLIKNGSDVNTADGAGRTALHFAAKVEVIELLLNSEADATATSQKGNTPLHLAASRACRQTVCLLLNKVTKPKASHKFINAKTVIEGSTALHVAAKKGAADVVSYLLEHGACYNSRDRSNNRTPLQCSSSLPVSLLLRLAEEVFEMAERGGTVLPQGDKRHLVVVLNSTDTENMTPPQVAMAHGHTTTTSLLLGLIKT